MQIRYTFVNRTSLKIRFFEKRNTKVDQEKYWMEAFLLSYEQFKLDGKRENGNKMIRR